MAKVKKAIILNYTRDFSAQVHAHNRPGNDPLHPHNVERAGSAEHRAGSEPQGVETISNPAPAVPYAGRVFTEDEAEAAVSTTLDFWLTLGKEGDALSAELGDFLGVKSCILTNSGSSANLLALAALTSHKLPPARRLLPGDEIITFAAGFPTTVAPIIQNGLVPVFIDNDPVTGNACTGQLEAA